MDDKQARIIYTLKRSAAALDYLSMIMEERDLRNPDVHGQTFILDMVSERLKKIAYDLGDD